MGNFECGTRIVSGMGAISMLKELNIQRLLLVSDPYFVQNGWAQKIGTVSGAENIQIFDKVQPDPTVLLAAEGTAAVREFQPDAIVALGGGSAMDCAKAMAFFGGGNAKFIAIPTTSGSGSEVTDFSILTHEQVKYPLIDRRLRPDIAILDGDLLEKLPPALVADCGFDVLSHALEAIVAQNANAITDALAKEAFRTAFSLLPASFEGDVEVRLAIHEASTMAGMAFTQAGLGICHALAHSLGGEFHIPHGRLNAILLPAVISANGEKAKEKYAAASRAAGLGGSADAVAVRNLRSGLVRLRRLLKLPQNLAQAGVDPRLLRQKQDKILSAALADPCCATNPVPVTRQLLQSVLEEVTGFA